MRTGGEAGQVHVEVREGAATDWWVAVEMSHGGDLRDAHFYGSAQEIGALARDIIAGLARMPLSAEEVQALHDIVEPLADQILEMP